MRRHILKVSVVRIVGLKMDEISYYFEILNHYFVTHSHLFEISNYFEILSY